MCDVNGPFKLCTCSEKIDKNKPYWVLKSNREDNPDLMVVGLFSQPNVLFTPIIRRNLKSSHVGPYELGLPTWDVQVRELKNMRKFYQNGNM